MSRSSITPDEIAAQKEAWPKDLYIVRNVNGDYGQHWSVSDAKTWNTVSLSYTKAEAEAICRRFNKKNKKKKGRPSHGL